MQPHAIETLLGWLGWQSLYVSIAAIVVVVVIRLCRVSDPRILLGLWGLVLLRFFLPLDLAMPWSARNQFHGAATAWVGSQAELRQHAQSGQRSAAQDVVTRVWLPSQASAVLAPPPPVASHFPWRIIAFCLWLVGVFTLGGLALRQHLKLLALLRRSAVVENAEVVAQVNQWRTRLNIVRAVTVRSGDVPMSPFTFGLRRPVIYMPAALLGTLTPAERDAVFGHELAHVRGLDMLWLIAERAVQILFFFHPVAWFATSQLALARERTCDLRAVRSGELVPSNYWSSVLAALRASQQDAPAFGLAPSLGPSAQPLKERILAMQQAQPMTRLKWVAMVCGTAILALLLLPMARSERAAAKAPPQVAQMPAPVIKPPVIKPPVAPAPPAPPAPVSVETAIDTDIDIDMIVAEAQRDSRRDIAHANQRLLAARESARRIAAGDFGNMIIVHDGNEVICPPGTSRQDIKCTRTFNQGDIVGLRQEAEAEVIDASQDLAQIRSEAQQAVIEARAEAQHARREAEQAAHEAEADAKMALAEAQRAQRDAYSRISEARVNAREIEIEALQGTLEGLRDAVRDLRNSHDHELASAQRSAKSQRIVNTSQIIAGVIDGLESSARQIEKQLAQARAK
jgi:beta-lactamase regulating signal transducer with metallopeptidase domain